MAYEQEKKFLANGAAKRVSYYCSPRTGGKRLVRRWTTTRLELMSSSLTYINTIMEVTSPEADGKVYPGTWRVISNTGPEKKTNPGEQGITQTLAQGILDDFKWPSSVTTLDDGYSYSYRDYAYVIPAPTPVRGEVSQASNTLNDKLLYDAEAGIIRSHPYRWDTLATDHAQGYSYDASYKNYHTRLTAPEFEGQGTVYDARSSMNRDGTYDGGVGYQYSRPITWNDVVNSIMGASYGVNYLNSRTRPEAPTTEVLACVYDAKSTVNKDATYNGNVNYEYSKPAEWYDRNNTVLDQKTAYSYLAHRTKPTAPADTAVGYVYDAKSALNKDGTYNGGIDEAYSKPARWHDATQSITDVSADYSYLNYRTKPAAPEAETIGFLYNAKSTLNRDGTYNGGVGYQYAKPARWRDVTENVLGTSLGHSYKNQRAKPTAPSALAQGFLYDGKSTLNRDGTYDGGVGYEYSKPVMLENTIESSLMTMHDLDYLAARTRPAAPAAAVQGLRYEVNSTLAKDSTYYGAVRYEYAKPVAMESTTSDSATETAHETAYLAYRDRPVAPGFSQGAIYDAKSSIQRDGTYNGNINRAVSKPVMMSAQVGGSFNSATYEVAYLNYRTRPGIPASTVNGTLYDARSTMARDGTYNGGVGYVHGAPVNFYLHWQSHEGGHGFYEWRNNGDPQAALNSLPGYTRNGVTAGYETNGKFRIQARITPVRIIGGGGSKIADDGSFTFYRRQYRGGFSEFRTLTITMAVEYHSSRKSAETFINGGADGSRVGVEGSYYVGTKYTISFGAWTDIDSEPDIT